MRAPFGMSAADFAAFLATLAVGVFASWKSYEYGLGRLSRIESGAFPFAIGLLLIVLAIALLVSSLLGDSRRGESISFRGILAVSGGMLAFIVLIEPLGAVITIALTTIISASADRSLGLRRILALAALASAMCSLVFIVLLDLPLRAFWW